MPSSLISIKGGPLPWHQTLRPARLARQRIKPRGSVERMEGSMRALNRRVCVALLTALPWQLLFAQRMTGGGLNYSPRPAVYAVISVDADERTVQLRAADGRTGTVFVSDEVFDVSTLKPGDKIRVDFVVPDETNKGLRAASVWLEK
jgi:hypothetical protein